MGPFATKANPWRWIPSLYFSQGLPYVIVMTVSVIMYKNLDISNAEIAFYTSWLYLPWVIKPLWSPFVEMFSTRRTWVLVMQFLLGAALACVALTIPMDNFFQLSLAFLWLMAFSSATHDIASDGFYLLALPSKDQAFFIGIRSTFYRVAMITGQGAVVVVAGYLEERLPTIQGAWSAVFGGVAVLYLLFFFYHRWSLPKPSQDEKVTVQEPGEVFKRFFQTLAAFFKKPQIGIAITFLMCYRLGESQLVKLASPFLLDERSVGGLGLSTQQVGVVYGTFGVIALTLGGILGGIVASRDGLKRWIWWMVAAINLPNIVYIYLSFAQPESFFLVTAAVVVEQFGYGFGFAGYLLYMIYIARGQFSTAHYALATGFMALGMMVPGMISGWVQELIGYQYFFVWVVIATIPSFVVTRFLQIDADFGKKEEA
ncbi:MFS transporter [Marinoscillum furvescens]|uniref:PAT family beta-lactamase induction signal transducer AmpG n=1 Tax=Marinoscillum furvescens DSM 4134 TaxID=1122208 RepID=A0A3D9L5H3_MARFU|nr:MFS transporter [Marinoscillum furvescens]REE01159.1 PAT family beta-lactamase induction signal transducer AmpG [Marinoscillum furvescens DSM 4134]